MSDSHQALTPSSRSDELAAWLALKDQALDVAAEGITIADARLPDRPLIYANEGFERMTGHTADNVLGRNCRFLQGPLTDPADVAAIRTALDEQHPCVVEILNYRKDGTTFWNRLSITPVCAASGEVTHFIGIQSDVTARRLAEESLRRSKEAMEQDLRLAAKVQQALLPPREVEVGRLRVAHAFHPCDDLAGDAVGIVPLTGDLLGLYLLDVSGHGVGAALLSVTLNHLLSAGADGALLGSAGAAGPAAVSPAGVAGRLNRQFPMDRTRQYFTLIYGLIDVRSGIFRYVTAGHPPPVLLPRGGSPAVVAGTGLPIGMFEDVSFEEASLTLGSGDRLYFYTDGVTEALDGSEEEFGHARLLAEIAGRREQPLREGLDGIAVAVRQWCGGRLRDDVSLLAVERVSSPDRVTPSVS
jgi:sigma-B regulation protein RsbU (phosphoserine phosphatase)